MINYNLKIFLMLMMTISMFSCSQKKSINENKTTARFVLAIGSSNYPGGLYVAAYNVGTGEKFGKTFFADNDSFTVPNGAWKFAAIGWKGAGVFQGENRCDLTPPFNLNGEPISVNLTLQASKCNNSFFGPSATRESGSPSQFKTLRVQNCMNLEYNLMHHPPAPGVEISCDGSAQSPLPGNAQSYRILLRSFVGNPLNTIGGTEFSSCRTFSGGNDNSPFKLPILQGPNTFPMHIKIKVYASGSCTNEIETFHFADGLKQNINFRAVADSYTSNNGLYTQSDLCSGNALTNPAPYSFHHGGTLYEYIVCNGQQFTALEPTGNMNQEAIVNIGYPINLGGESGYQITTFNGKMIGNFHPIINSDETLVDNLLRKGSFEMMRLEGGSITGTDQAVLVNHILHGTNNIQEINFRDIQIINTNINTSQDNVGYIFGEFLYDTTSAPNPYDGRIVLDNILIDNTDGSKIEGAGGDVKGGLIGYIYSTDPNPGGVLRKLEMEIRHADINTDIQGGTYGSPNTSNSMYIGGAIGRINMQNDPEVLANINLSDVRFRGQKIIGQENIGGLVGSFVGSQFAELEIIKGIVEHEDSSGTDFPVEITCVSAAADANCGGIVGELNRGMIINSYSYNEIYIDPSIPSTSSYGGLCGNCLEVEMVSNSIITRLTTSNSLSDKISRVGGVVGYMRNSIVLNHFVDVDSEKLKTVHFGGLAGNVTKDGAGAIDSNIIKGNLLTGSHEVHLYDTTNAYYAGSITGTFAYGTMKNNISYIDMNSGNSNHYHLVIGGFAGQAGGVTIFLHAIEENTYRGNITLDKCTANVKSGLAVGRLDNTYFNYNVASGNFNFSTDGTINGSCGMATGEVLLTPAYTAQYEGNMINVSNNTASLVSMDGSSFADWTDVGVLSMGTCDSSYTPPMIWDSNISECIPEYEDDMLAIGDTNNDGHVDLAGNFFDPIEINTVAKWNEISNVPAYLTKSYELKADLDFGDNPANFEPIGGLPANDFPGKAFIGSLMNPDGHVLSNIRINASSGADNIGIIRKLGSDSDGFGMVGQFLEPLIIDGLKIDYGPQSPNYLGAIGFIDDGMLSIEVTNAEYFGSGTPVAVGGIAGGARDAEIMGCLFHGSLGPATSSYITRLGGVIGKANDPNSVKINIGIEMCGVRLARFHADSAANTGKAGGMIGEIPDVNGHYSIHGSYVHFESNGIITADIFGGMIALIGNNISISSQLDITIGESFVYRPSGAVGGTVGQTNAIFNDGISNGGGYYTNLNGIVLGNRFEGTNGEHGVANSTDTNFPNDLNAVQSDHPNFVWLAGENRFGLFFEHPSFIPHSGP
ncbi:hypothetical protein N9N67_07945 [Bacteriovoracaceae bacterium]|nr:hypothetical protein [Bacteriovoracaceae bacterium]